MSSSQGQSSKNHEIAMRMQGGMMHGGPMNGGSEAPAVNTETSSSSSSASSSGQAIYESDCVACHGQSGHGAIPQAPDLTNPHGVLSKPVDELLRIVESGKGIMPPKGGHPELTKEELKSVILYMKEAF